ncbi:MAG: ATP-binding protein [Selenomonadaceae bacterium]|nr:ATP-binding protein [Selenomonadaceae bacterium]MBQ9496165.1 ATP-binding protein [Selenomonadaceae bacterium]
MSLWKRITPTDEKKAEEEIQSVKKSKEPSIEFYPEEPKYSFDEIILPQAVKDKILDVANYAENSKKVFEEWGLQAVYKQSRRIGINLYGEPGTGKTMAAHAIAKHLGRKILAVNYADIESKYVGETPKNIRKAFEAAAATNSILFFDEADAILSKRVTNMSSATDVSVNQTRSVMLMVMNDYQDFVIFATNFISNFDPAFMRRISTHIEFKLPDLDCRKKLWQHYILPTMPNNIDIDELAEKYDGLSGSDISNAVLMAAFKSARQNAELVDKSLVFEAVEETLASKNANKGITVEKRVVSEEYVKEQVAKGKGVIRE